MQWRVIDRVFEIGVVDPGDLVLQHVGNIDAPDHEPVAVVGIRRLDHLPSMRKDPFDVAATAGTDQHMIAVTVLRHDG